MGKVVIISSKHLEDLRKNCQQARSEAITVELEIFADSRITLISQLQSLSTEMEEQDWDKYEADYIHRDFNNEMSFVEFAKSQGYKLYKPTK
jgi:hypothetical protein